MVRRENGTDGLAIIVTYPTIDRVASLAVDVGGVLFTRWYISAFPQPAAGIYLVLMLLVISVVSTFITFRTRVIVKRDEIKERRFRWKTFTLADDVSVVTENLLVRLRDANDQLLYGFPSGLAHRGELEKQLRRLFGKDHEEEL